MGESLSSIFVKIGILDTPFQNRFISSTPLIANLHFIVLMILVLLLDDSGQLGCFPEFPVRLHVR